MANIVIDRLFKTLPSNKNVSSYKDGERILVIDDATVYVLSNNDWIKDSTIKPGETYQIKSLDDAVYKVNNKFKLQPIWLLNEKGKGIREEKVQKTKKSTILQDILNIYLPKTSSVLQTSDSAISSMEVLLPIILDNYSKFLTRGRSNTIRKWLIDNEFVDENSVTNKAITSKDLRNFAVVVCRELKSSNNSSLGYSSILGNFFDTKYKLTTDTDSPSYTLDNVLDKLRSNDLLYSSKKDIALRNIVNTTFLYDDIGIRKDNEGNEITFNQEISILLSRSWFSLIDKEGLLQELGGDDFIRSNCSNELRELNKGNINCWTFFSELSKVYKKIVSDNSSFKNKSLYEKIKEVIVASDPKSLIFLVERLMVEAEKLTIEESSSKELPNETKKINEKQEEELKYELVKLTTTNETIKKISKFKTFIEKFLFKGFSDQSELVPNQERYRLKNDILVKNKEFINPKTLSTVDTDAFKLLCQPDAVPDGEYIIDDVIKKLKESNKLYSVAEMLKNPSVINDLTKFYTTAYISYYLKNNEGTNADIADYQTVYHSTKKVVQDPKSKEKSVKNVELSKELKNSLVLDLEKLVQLSKNLKPEISLIQALISEVQNQTYNKSSDILDTDATVTEKHIRDMLYTIDMLFQSLATYIVNIKNGDLSGLDFEEIVKNMESNRSVRNLFVIDYAQIINKLKASFNSEVGEFLQLLNKYKSLDSVDIENLVHPQTFEKLPPEWIQKCQRKAEVFVNDIVSKIMTALDKDKPINNLDKVTEVNTDIKLEKDPAALTLMGSYNNFLNIIYAAASAYTLDDVEEFLSTLKSKNDVMLGNQNLMSQEINKDVSLLYSTAKTIINFINLKSDSNMSKEDINKRVNDLVSQAVKYSDIYPEDLDLNFVSVNINEITNIIDEILNSKDTQYSYNGILNSILTNMNKNLGSVRADPIDNDELFTVFQELKINTFDSSLVNDIVSAANAKGISVTNDDVYSYVANKLFYMYKKSLTKDLKQGDESSLVEYLDYQKFNLTLDIADSFNNGQFSNLLQIYQFDQIDLKYFMNAEMIFNELKNRKAYRLVPDNVIKAMANYKVVDYINLVLYKIVNNNRPLAALLEGCTDWDFSDKLINNMLSKCKIFNINGELADSSTSKDLLSEVKSNMIEPISQRYLNYTDDVFRSAFNKIKNLNRNSLRQNATVAAEVLRLVTYQKSRIAYIHNNLSRRVIDKLKQIDIELSEKKSLLAKKNINVDTFDKTILKKIREKIDGQVYVDIVNYLDIKEQKEQINKLKSEVDASITDIEKKIKEVYDEEQNQLKVNIPDIKKFIADSIENDPILKAYTVHSSKFNKPTDRYSEINEKLTSHDLLPIDLTVDLKKIVEDQELQISQYVPADKQESVRNILNKLNYAYEVIGKLFHNSLAASDTNTIDSLQKLLFKIDTLKQALSTKVDSLFREHKQTFITKELVYSKVKALKDALYTKLATITSSSDTCLNITSDLSKVLNNTELNINKLNTLIL